MRLETYLIKNGIPPIEFAVKAGTSLMTIYRYINGKRPNLRNAKIIETLTNGEVSIEDLIFGEDHAKSNR